MIQYDEALEAAIQLIRDRVGQRDAALTLIRDVTGQLTAVLADDALPSDQWNPLADTLHARLGPLSPGPARVLLHRSDLIDEDDVFKSPDLVRISDGGEVWLLDRLLTNQDWVRKPKLTRSPRPLGVAFSLKGGVGRSTALAVLAWHLARLGKKVLAVDLDLEAPGLGSILLAELPDYGAIDWLVDALITEPDPKELRDCIAMSPVASDSPGVVQVMPAFGRLTRNYVAKIGRVFFPALQSDGSELGIAERFAMLMHLLSEQDESPDVVLLDARAGLHDIGAAAVTQLGAEAFLFARDEPQGWEAYRLLFEHLARSKGVAYGMPDEDLRWRLKMVAAQIDKTEGALSNWIEASYEAWSALYDDESKPAKDHPVAQIFSRDDSNAPHYPLSVYFDTGLRGTILTQTASRPQWSVIEAAFGGFLAEATTRLLGEDADSQLDSPSGAR